MNKGETAEIDKIAPPLKGGSKLTTDYCIHDSTYSDVEEKYAYACNKHAC